MSVRLLIDMNLSPDWVPALERHGQHDADLAVGALIVVDESGTRARILPI
ncbi:MAG: hypothetical protein GKR89_07040 [Candidatus Latescibacteria bacterium]|nr:hypothetical protein [Candidatus Latescibacterota bacterium]